MPAIYLANVIGDGTTTANAYKPDVPAGTSYVCLMIHEAKARAVIASPDATLVQAGLTKLVQGATWAALRTTASTTNPTAPQRTAVATWLSNNGYQALTAQTTWADVILFVARQVNPAADLTITQVS